LLSKGRVESNHGTDQDRLVKELSLAGISAIEKANIKKALKQNLRASARALLSAP